MSYNTIVLRYHIESGYKIAEVLLNRPKSRNAMDAMMIEELTHVFTQGVAEDSRAIILKGEGASFCAGADLQYMKSMIDYSHEENLKDSELLAGLFRSIVEATLPVIAVVHGHAYGGGTGLLAACDVIIADANCKFCFSEVKLGLAPAVISPFVAARIGYTACRRFFLTGEVFTSALAKEISLINEISNSDQETKDLVCHYIKHFINAAPTALSSIKHMLNSAYGLNLNRSSLNELIATLRESDEGQEGMSAFFEKRKPRWINQEFTC